jgi:hypothetical protein
MSFWKSKNPADMTDEELIMCLRSNWNGNVAALYEVAARVIERLPKKEGK